MNKIFKLPNTRKGINKIDFQKQFCRGHLKAENNIFNARFENRKYIFLKPTLGETPCVIK